MVIRTLSYAGGQNLAGASIPAGGFDPTISLFDSAKNLVVDNRDGGCANVAADPVSGFCWDSYLAVTLPAGNYSVVLTQSENLPNGPALVDSFVYAGQPDFTTPAGVSSQGFWDAFPSQRTNAWALDIAGAASAVTTITSSSQLPFEIAARPYSFTFTASSGANAALTWSVASGTLPPGLNLDSATGVLSGTPTAPGNFPFTVQVSDGIDTVSQSVAPTVYGPVTISTTSLPAGSYHTTYNPPALAASGGSGSYSWTVSGLPGGLNATTAGTISGLPNATGTFPVSISVSDLVTGLSASVSLVIAVNYPALQITTAVNPNGMVNQAYGPVNMAAVGGAGGPYTWSGGGIAGITVSSGGVISGTPATPGTQNLSITVTDPVSGFTSQQTYSVNIAPAPLTITTTSLPNGAATAPYGPFTLSANGGTGTYSWSGSGAPAGVTVTVGGSVGGTPAASGSFTISVTVTDQAGKSASASFTISISPASVTISGAGNLGGFVPGASISGAYSGGGGRPPYTFTANGLPGGLTLSAAGGLSGAAPSSAGSYSFAVTVSDSETPAQTASINTQFSVLGLNGASLPSGSTGTAYSGSVSAAGGTPPYSYSASGVPAGLSFSAAGSLSGTPTSAGTFTLSVSVSDSTGLTVSGSFGLTIASGIQPVQVSGATLSGGSLKEGYSQSLKANNGKPPYSWTLLAGTLPAGLMLSPSGTIAGTPTAAGSSSFTAQATDSAGGFASAAFTIVVASPALAFGAVQFPDGIATAAYPPQIIAATGGAAPYTYAVTSGSLPPGLSFSDGQISGTPTAAGSGSFTVTATDSAGAMVSAAFTITVDPAMPALVLAQASVPFALTSNSTVLPAAAVLAVRSSETADVLSYSVSNSGASWLTVNGGAGKTPGAIGLSVNSAALTLESGTYSASVTVTCVAPSPCAGQSQMVEATIAVSAPAPQLAVSSSLLSFSASTGTAGPMSQPLDISNSGGGTISIASIAAADPWVSIAGVPSTIAAGASAPLTVSVNPAGLANGYYQTSISIATSAGSATVEVTLLIAAAPTLTLSPAGMVFTALSGSAPGNTSGSFAVSVSGTGSVPWTTSVASGGDASWLTLNTASGSSTSDNPGAISYSVNASAAAALPAGNYYATIDVASNAVVDPLSAYQIVLNISPAASSAPAPNPLPSGLIFLANGSASLPPQTVQVYTGSGTPVTYQASSDSSWLTVSPATDSISSTFAGPSAIAVNPGSMAPGVYRGNVSYAITSAASVSVNVTLIVESAGATPVTSTRATTSSALPAQTSGVCAPAQLVPTATGIPNNFSQPTSWPTPLTITLLDDCGSPVTNGQIVATFTNGDPPLVLQAIGSSSGVYSGTWTPRAVSQQLTISARATAPNLQTSTIQIAGQVTPNAAPVLNPNGTINAFLPAPGSPLAPGMIVQIYGANLAGQTKQSSALPLTTSLANTSVLIGGVEAPLYFVSPGQINALVPANLNPGQPYQVLINANGALSTPISIQTAEDAPGIAALSSGQIIAQHADGTLISDTSPAAPGEYIVFYVAGMGPTSNPVPSGQASPSSPLAVALDQPVLTLNGVTVPIYFAGLTPTFVGLYQVNFQIPGNMANGDLQLILTQSGGQSNATVLAVHN